MLREEGVDGSLLGGVEEFKKENGEEREGEEIPHFVYYGSDVWNRAISAILSGLNLLLVGAKATGKNVLSENLAYLFSRKEYGISFHIDVDAEYLIGTDTLRGGEVVFRKGPVCLAAENGGFAIFDEINMAKNEALSVLHSVLDHRRIIDIPGYESMRMHPATRFIATMNYGYAGTRELNEALVSRFAVIDMPPLGEEGLTVLLSREFPNMDKGAMRDFVRLFMALCLKAQNGEISDKTLDLRGLLDALRLMRNGLDPKPSLEMGIVCKSFDPLERDIIRDAVKAHISKRLKSSEVFK